MKKSVLAVAVLGGILGSSAVVYSAITPEEQATSLPQPPAKKIKAPAAARQAFFGDLHLHTANSFDAYVLMGTKTTPEDAYQFARGDTINYLGERIKRADPLDFLAVTDHSENIGVFNELDDPNSGLSKSPLGARIKNALSDGMLSLFAKREGKENALTLLEDLLNPKTLKEQGINAQTLSSAAWRRNVNAANRYYQPGKFTTFIGYEWSSMPNGQNLHRNVIFRGNDAPNPFSSVDSYKPEDLWSYLSTIRSKGFEALAIPHNANASGGLMYDWANVDGKPLDAAYALLRSVNEPLSEIAQNKGTSETHPSLSPNDEFANFEIFDRLLISPQFSRPEGSYLRDALGKGLVLKDKLGVNPYKDGFVGAGDLHGGLPVQSEANFGGNIGAVNLGGGRTSKENAKSFLAEGTQGGLFSPIITTSAGLTGVWAEQNTRESIYDAFRRKETFATSGTRVKVRFFGGWDLANNLNRSPDGVKQAYAKGVPMGSDLPQKPGAAKAPSFVIWAVKDPNGANLDRAQVIKVWTENGVQKEKVFDVAFDNKRKLDKNGKLAAVGNTVDLSTGKFTNTIGSSELSTVWQDPEFNAKSSAVYYVRVLEIPTPRWSTLLALQHQLPLPQTVPATIQERAWTSPIWYTPAS